MILTLNRYGLTTMGALGKLKAEDLELTMKELQNAQSGSTEYSSDK